VPVRTVVVPIHIVGDEHDEVGRRGWFWLRLRAAEHAAKQRGKEKQKAEQFGRE
jgi:hypothetical protein